MKERPEEIQLILDNLGKQLTELRESVGVKRSYIYRNGSLPAGSVISIESATRDSYVKSLFEYIRMIGGYILLKSRDKSINSVEIESIDGVKKAFDQILYNKGLVINWIQVKTGIELRVISRAITGSKESKVGMLFLCADVLGFDFFVRKKDGFVLPNKAKKLMINKVLPEYNTKLMTRTEFCEMLISARKQEGLNRYAVSKKINFSPWQIKVIETGSSNNSMIKIIEYLKCINFCIHASSKTKHNEIKIIEYDDFTHIIKKTKKELRGYISIQLGITPQTIRNIEQGRNKTSIDVFLKYMQIFGYTIELKKIE